MKTAKSRRSSPRGRAGGRAGGSGYDFQDLYVAYHLAKLLVGDRDPPVEVFWEKKALDRGSEHGPDPVHVDDAILHLTSGKSISVQVKENAPDGGWSVAQLVKSGVADQFWREWSSRRAEERPKAYLRLAGCGDMRSLTLLVDVALRSRTARELLTDEASADAAEDLSSLAAALAVDVDAPEFLAFLKSIQTEPLCAAGELEGWIVQSLAVFGDFAPDLGRRLIRFVGRSKHAGNGARSSFTKQTLVSELRDDGVRDDVLIAAGVLRAKSIDDRAVWDWYREQVVRKFRSFRVYGLQVERAVYADLPALFVPLMLEELPRSEPNVTNEGSSLRGAHAPSLAERLSAEFSNDDAEQRRTPDRGDPRKGRGVDFTKVVSEHTRFAIVGGPGTGKTTSLKWIAVVSALSDAEGERQRLRLGLPAQPQVPVYVRFRQFAERVMARGLGGVEGRVGLVADFLAAELEAGMVGRVVARTEALQMAQEILESSASLFLFDGLDEVADEAMRHRLFEAVADLARTYKAPRIVVSSRPYAFKRERSPLDLAIFRPLPLTQESIRSFAHQWYKAVRTTLGDSLGASETRARAEDLARAAESLPDLAEVPLLLSILALVHFNRQGLPLARATLYDHATLAMLGHWERDPAGRDLGEDAVPSDWARRLRLGEKEIRRVVECLAFSVQVREGGGEFNHIAAIAGLSEGLQPASPVGKDQVSDQAHLLLRLLIDRAGLIQERSPNIYAFVHLSFQEYLAARWFVGRGADGIPELIGLAGDDRHAEVLRLTVAILAADQRAEADERILRVIHSVSDSHPALAAACLLEAPRTKLDKEVAERLANAVYSECSTAQRHYFPARVTARLVWGLLALTTGADRVLLSLIANSLGDRGPHDFPRGFRERDFEREFRHRKQFRHFEDGPMPIRAVLAARPARPMAPDLSWVLRRLSSGDNFESSTALQGIATLLLIEAGTEAVSAHVVALVSLLEDQNREDGPIARRVSNVLEALCKDPHARLSAIAALSDVIVKPEGGRGRHIGLAAAQFLISIGEGALPAIPKVLVEEGFYARSRHVEVSTALKTLFGNELAREYVIAALTTGLRNADADVRFGCSHLMTELGIVVPGFAAAGVADEDITTGLKRLATDASTREKTLAALAEDLWAEDDSTSWQAALTLIEVGELAVSGLIFAATNAGLFSRERRSVASEYIRQVRREAGGDVMVRGALLSALSSQHNSVASAAALLFMELESATNTRRLVRVLLAALRDPDQFAELELRLRGLLNDAETRAATIEALGKYFGGKPDRQVVRGLVRIIGDAKCLDVQNLAKQLVEHGLYNAGDHDEVIAVLRRMLEDPELVTATRRTLSEGLASSDADVVWGSARCLWESGSHTDAKLASALAIVGLQKESNRTHARGWLLELLSHPRTAKFARRALETAAGRALNASGGRSRDLDLAWSVSECLVSGGVMHAEDLAAALVIGGLHVRQNHDRVIEFLKDLRARDARLAGEIDEAALEALGDADANVRWGASRLLAHTGATAPWTTLLDDADPKADYPESDEDADGRMKTVAKFWAVVISESAAESQASEWLKGLKAQRRMTGRRRQVLIQLLKDDNTSVALAAAHYLLTVGVNVSEALQVIVDRGLSDRERNVQISGALDSMLLEPGRAPVVTEALSRALWSSDSDTAWRAAIYILQRKMNVSNPGIPRALAFGGLSERPADALARLRVLIADPITRQSTIDALGAALYLDDEGRFRAACLLVEARVETHQDVLAALDSAGQWWPWVPLAALALSHRIDEVRQGATQFQLERLLRLVGPDGDGAEPR